MSLMVIRLKHNYGVSVEWTFLLGLQCFDTCMDINTETNLNQFKFLLAIGTECSL